MTYQLRQRRPTLKVALVKTVLKRADGKALYKRFPIAAKFRAVICQSALRHTVDRILGVEPLAGGGIESDLHMLCVIACFDYRFADDLKRRIVGRHVRGKAALVAYRGGKPAAVQETAERVIYLGGTAKRLAEVRKSDGNDHEFLDFDIVRGVRAAVEYIEHRYGQTRGAHAAEIPEKRHPVVRRRSFGGGKRYSQRSVGTEIFLVLRAVGSEDRTVHRARMRRINAAERRVQNLFNAGNS